MNTMVGNGYSTHRTAATAAAEATRLAMTKLGSAKPTCGFVFASPGIACTSVLLGAAVSAARETSGAEIVGCTTAGDITEEGLRHQSVVVLLISGDATLHAKFARGLKGQPKQLAAQLWSGVGEVRKDALARGHRYLATVLFTDGLAATGETLVGELYERRVQSGTQLVGGAAGDEGRFEGTHVAGAGQSGSDAAAALHVFDKNPWGVGVDHGLTATTKPMRVTRSAGNVVHEIDGQPAFAVYQRHAAERGITLTQDNAGPYLIANELGVHFFERISRARAPLSVGSDGSIVCAGDIPRGSMVTILNGEPENMVTAARTAALQAKAHLHGRDAAGVLLFDCVCRGMILKEHFDKEIQAVRSVFPGAPTAGFLTYGEIARNNDRLEGWHNTTAVVVAIPS
jgi:hypothetical protein